MKLIKTVVAVNTMAHHHKRLLWNLLRMIGNAAKIPGNH